MKNVLNAVSAILIILFLGWQFCGDCCEKKCDKSDTKECDYSKCEKSGATKCKSYETKKECPHANKEESIVTEEENTTVEEVRYLQSVYGGDSLNLNGRIPLVIEEAE